MTKSTNTVLLIDSNALIHRAYHAFPKHLVTKDGVLVNAAYGFTRLLLTVLKQFDPEYVVCAFDTHAPTFRHKMYKEYKATRAKTDEELIEQFPIAKQVVESLNIPILSIEGLEADDIIGTLSKDQELKDVNKIVVTGDKDLLQLIDEKMEVFLSGNSFSKSQLYGQINVVDKLGFSADKLIEFKGLRGDSSDNIPGVKGVGEKIAGDLIKEYGTIENVYDHLDKLKTAAKNRLTGNYDIALLSRNLATIKLDADLDFRLADAKLSDYDQNKTIELFNELEFRSLIKDLPKVDQKRQTGQMGLMDSATEASGNQQKQEPEIEYLSFDNSNFAKLIDLISDSETIAIDIELIEENIFSKIKQIALNDGGDSLLIAFSELSEDNKLRLSKLLNKAELVACEAKKINHGFLSEDVAPVTVDFDIQVAEFLLGYARSKVDLENMAFTHLNQVYDTSKDMPIEAMQAYRSELVFRLHEKLSEDLESAVVDTKNDSWNFKKLFYELEMPLQKVLVEMERNGIFLDSKYLLSFASELDNKIEKISEKIFQEIGDEVNLASPKQLGEALFGKMKLPGGKKTKTGNYSTNERVLSNLKNDYPIVKDILEYREISKLRSTYTDALVDLIDKKTGRIHSSFSQVVAATGRLASSKPNLQNIPISTQLGHGVRKAFKATDGKVLVFIDYSQQELRLLAHFSQESNLIDAFKQGKDIHALTASNLFAKDIEDVTKNERRIGKTVNFGVVYGISAFGLSDRLDMSRKDGQVFIDAFFDNYPKVKDFFTGVIKEAKQKGYVQTILGRRRDTSLLNSRNYQLRSATEREVVNYPLQGSAADMMKIAMLRVYNLIKSKYPEYAKLILQIHDELVFEVDEEELSSDKFTHFINEVRDSMLNVLELELPMKVDVEVGENLSETRKL